MISDPDLAAKITALMLETSNRLNESLIEVRDQGPEDEFRRCRLAIGKIMGEMLLKVLNPSGPETWPRQFFSLKPLPWASLQPRTRLVDVARAPRLGDPSVRCRRPHCTSFS